MGDQPHLNGDLTFFPSFDGANNLHSVIFTKIRFYAVLWLRYGCFGDGLAPAGTVFADNSGIGRGVVNMMD